MRIGTKVVLVGDSGVGKTSYVKRIKTGEFEYQHVPTMGVEVHPYKENDGVDFDFKFWDTAGHPDNVGLGSGYYMGAHGAMVMFDVMDKQSFKNVPKWINGLKESNPLIPIIVCGNKVDLQNRKVKPHRIKKFLSKYPDIHYFDLSARSCYNFEKPLYCLNDIIKTFGHM